MLLGREIDHMITTARKSQTDAAEMIDTRQSRIADLVAGNATITIGDLERLANQLGFTDPGYQAELFELRRDYQKRGFWTTGHRRAYHEDFRLMVDLEKSADLLRCVGSEMVPDIIQCEAYIRALFSQPDEGDAGEITAAVQARLARQEVLLNAESDAEYHVVMSESCLHTDVGSAAVMREQIDHMVKLSKRSNVQIQVKPFKRPIPRGSHSLRPFQLVKVPSPGLAGPLEIAYVEGPGEIRYLDDAKAFAAYQRAWSRLTAVAVSPDDTRKFLRTTANLLYRQG